MKIVVHSQFTDFCKSGFITLNGAIKKQLVWYGDCMFYAKFLEVNNESFHKSETVELCDDIEWVVIIDLSPKYRYFFIDLVTLSYKEFKSRYSKIYTGDIQLGLIWFNKTNTNLALQAHYNTLYTRFMEKINGKLTSFDFCSGTAPEKYTGYEMYLTLMQ